MGNQTLDEGANGEQASFEIVAYPAKDLPKDYESFVYAKWLRSLKHGNDYFKLVDSDPFFAAYKVYIKALLSRPMCVLRFACLKDDPDTLLGWSLMERTTLHYVFVQYEFRNTGIAKALVPGTIDTITHLTKSGMSIWHNKLPSARFNPFA